MCHLGTEGTIAVNTLTLDSVIPRDGKTKLVKMDIEGSEDKALLGMAETICDSRPVIFFECNPGGPAAAIETTLRGYGYRLYSIVGGHPCELKKLVPEEFSHGHHNFLASTAELP